MNIKNFIKIIRDSFHGSTHVYTRGNCYRLYVIVKFVFPEAEAFYEADHIVIKYHKKFYDITGEVESDFVPFKETTKLKQKNIMKNKFGISGYIECPNCDEVFEVKEIDEVYN